MAKVKMLGVAGWIITGILLGILPYFYNGVFFERGHVIVDLCLIAILLVWLLWMIISRIYKRTVDTSQYGGAIPSANKESPSSMNRYDIAFALYVLLYVLGPIHSANTVTAVQAGLDSVALVFPYILFRSRIQDTMASGWTLLGLAVSSVSINVVGMANGWNQLKFPTAFDKSQGIQVSSVFQYHNTYAAFVSAVGLGLLVYMALRKSESIWIRYLYIATASLDISGLIFSGSRGALALWIGVAILTVIGLRDEDVRNEYRTRLLALVYVAGLGSAVGYPFLHKGMAQANAVYGWIGIAVTFFIPIAIYAVASLFVKRASVKLLQSDRKFEMLIGLGAVVAVVGAFVMSHSLLSKLQTYHVHQLSVVQRFIFWKDGLKIFAQDPVFGMGGGAWMSMFFKVQSYPYYSTRVHSFVIDILMEVGALGFVALVVALWPMIKTVIWPLQQKPIRPSDDSTSALNAWTRDAAARRALGTVALALFAHSLMDWDMPFLFIEMLFVMGLGAGVRLHTMEGVAKPDAPVASEKRNRIVYFTTIPATLVAILAMFSTVQMVRAEDIASHASSMPVGQPQIQAYEKAHQLVPYDPSYIVAAANALGNGNITAQKTIPSDVGTQSLEMYRQASNLDRFNPSIQATGANIAFTLGDYASAAEMADNAFNDGPFVPTYVSMAMNAYALDGLKKVTANPNVAVSDFRQIQTLLAQYQQRYKVVQNLPSYLPPSTPYQLDPFTYDSLAVSFLAFHQPQQALQLASTVKDNKDAHTADVAKLITMLAEQDLGKQVSMNDVLQYILKHPSVQGSYQGLLNLRSLVK